MKRTAAALIACLLAVPLAACDAFKAPSSDQLTPMPGNVYDAAVCRTADDVVAAGLKARGITCDVLRRKAGGLDCRTAIDGAEVENQIQVLDPKKSSGTRSGTPSPAGAAAATPSWPPATGSSASCPTAPPTTP